MNNTTFPDHGWRFGKPKAFYITIDDTLIENSNILGGKILREAGLLSEQLLEILRQTTDTEIIKVIINTL